MKKILAPLVLCLTLGGCSAAYTKQPFGDTPKPLTDEVEQWEGTWMHPDGTFTVKVKDAAKGILTIGWIDSGGEGLKPEVTDVLLRTVGSWTFASLKDKDKPDFYIWGRIEREDRQIVIWGPDLAKLRPLVESGKLPGTVTEDGDIILGTLGDKELKILTSEEAGVLFDWSSPFVLFKLGS